MHISARKVFIMVLGKTMNSHKDFMHQLSSKMNLHEVHSMYDTDIIIAFVPIASRAGTDIQAALDKIPKHLYKHIILVSLHHTFNPHYIAPDSRHSVHRSDVFAVDCLYHEDQGLLNCRSNEEALKSVIKQLGGEKSSDQVSAANWTSGVDKIKLGSWILAVLCSFLVFSDLLEGNNFYIILIVEILLIIMAASLSYCCGHMWSLLIFLGMNIVVFIQRFKSEEQDFHSNESF